MDFRPSEEERLLRETAKKIAGRFGHAYYAAKARAGGRMDELWRALAEHGLIGVHLPEAHGGGGLGVFELAAVSEELAAAGCPSLMLIVSSAICGSILLRHGSQPQKERWLSRLASGEAKMAFAITEADAGSNSHRIATQATRTGGGWTLSGSKHFISGADEAEAMLVVARTGVDAKGRAKLSLFIADTKVPGLAMQLIPVEIAAPEKQFIVFFDGVELGPDRLIGAEGDGLRCVFAGLNPERITVAAISNGIGRYALSKAAGYAKERSVWGAPIGAHQGIAHPLARAWIEVELARLMTEKAAWLHDQGADSGEAANIAKYAAAEAALFALDQSIQTHGGNGLTQEYGLADLWGLARLLRTAPVSREMILNFVAQHSLGLPKSY